jgi:hypothetical protein
MDESTQRNFPNVAPRQVPLGDAWADWRGEEHSRRGLYQHRGLTICFTSEVLMDFWGIDLGVDDPVDPDDLLATLAWTGWGDDCPAEAWEGGGEDGLPRNTCEATAFVGGVGDCDDDDRAYRFSAVWSRSAPVEVIEED